MKKLLLTGSLCGIFALHSHAQSPVISWQKSLGGAGNESAYSIRRTIDPGYIVGGSSTMTSGDVTGNNGAGDFWVTKIDETGSLLWQRSIGGTGDDAASSVQQVTGSVQGDYIIAGSSSSSDGDFAGSTQHGGGGDFAFVRYNAPGVVAIQNLFGGSGYDYASAVQPYFGGGYVMAGYSESTDGDITNPKGASDFWVVKITGTGTLQWQKSYGGSAGDYANNMAQTNDGGFIVVGSSESTNGDVTGGHGAYDFWVVKIDTGGAMTWQKTFGGTNWDLAYSVEQTTDNGYIVAGYSLSTDGDVTGNHGGNGDFWVIKLSSTGTLEWQKTLGGSGTDRAASVLQTSDGGYFVTGSTNSTDGDVTGVHGADDFWAVKLNSTGNLVWQKALGSTQVDGTHSACLSQAGDYVIAGFANASDGDVTGFQGGSGDFWVVQLDGTPLETDGTSGGSNFDVYPNPASNSVSIQVKPAKVGSSYRIVDGAGKLLLSGKLREAENAVDIAQLPAGFYILQIGSGSGNAIKLIKR